MSAESDAIKRIIYYDYKIERPYADPKRPERVVVWYDKAGNQTHRTGDISTETLAKNMAETMYHRYSPKAQEELAIALAKRVGEPIRGYVSEAQRESNNRMHEAYFGYDVYRLGDKFVIQWYNSKHIGTRKSEQFYASYESAMSAAHQIQIGVFRKFKGLPMSSGQKPLATSANQIAEAISSYNIFQESTLWWISWKNYLGKEIAKSPVGFATKASAEKLAGDVLSGRSMEKFYIEKTGVYANDDHIDEWHRPLDADFGPRTYHYEMPKSWDEKWFDGIGKWFPEGIPEDIKEALK